jgi:hypothetical protein
VTATGSAPAYLARPVIDGHAIEVRLTYAGKPHAAWSIPGTYATHCGAATEVPDPSLEVDAKGAVTGAVVWLDDVHEGEPLPVGDAVQDEKGCAFLPHVLAMPAGARLHLTNGDPGNHAVRLDVDAESVVKMLPPGGADTIATRGVWAGHVGRVTCPIHPWMLAWVHFFDHPYFAVTRGGVARLEKVPPGTWHVSVWHEALDAKKGDTVTEGEPLRARLEVKVSDRDVVRSLTLRDDGSIR